MAEKKDEKLKHSVGGTTTRDDELDSGVPMMAGDPSEPVGPEDALGSGPKRGDYSQVIGDRQYYHSVLNPEWDPASPYDKPRFVLVHQNPLVKDRGDDKGAKGGTHPLADEVKKK